MYLVDASALVNILLSVNDAEELIKLLRGAYILDLTVYEFNKALWKLATITKKIGKEAAKIGAEILEWLISNGTLYVLSEHKNLGERISAAIEKRINFYDYSYIHAAKSKGLILVSDDKGMRINAKNFGVTSINTKEFIKRVINRGD